MRPRSKSTPSRLCFAVRWRDTPVRNLQTRRGNWHYSEFYALVDTAHEWGYRPSELGLCKADEDLAVMQAYTDTTMRMRSHENLEREKAINRNRKRR